MSYPNEIEKPRRRLRFAQLQKYRHRMRRVAIKSEFILMCHKAENKKWREEK